MVPGTGTNFLIRIVLNECYSTFSFYIIVIDIQVKTKFTANLVSAYGLDPLQPSFGLRPH